MDFLFGWGWRWRVAGLDWTKSSENTVSEWGGIIPALIKHGWSPKKISLLSFRACFAYVCACVKGKGGKKDLIVIAKLSGLEIDTGDTRLSLSLYSSLLIEKHRSKGETITVHFDTFLFFILVRDSEKWEFKGSYLELHSRFLFEAETKKKEQNSLKIFLALELPRQSKWQLYLKIPTS